MTKIINILIIGLISVLLSNCYTEEDLRIQQIPTSVKGYVLDVERNVAYTNDTIILIKHYSCGSWFTSGPCSLIIDSTATDNEGKYEFNFKYELDGSYYVYRKANFLVFPEDLELPTIIAGEKNIADFEIWRPIIFKIDLKVRNNDFPDLFIKSRIEDDFYILHDFPDVTIKDQKKDTIIYLYAKPNSNMRISFDYSDDHPTANYHEYRDFFTTAKQDTIELSYEIDCQSF